MADSLIFLDLTLKGKAVKGDSVVNGFKGLIELKSMHWRASYKSPFESLPGDTAGGFRAGENLSIEKYLDASTPLLMQLMDDRADSRTHTKEAEDKFKKDNRAVITVAALHGRSKNEAVNKLMEIELAGCRVKKISSKTGAGGLSISLDETLELDYLGFKLTYFQLNAKTDTRSRVSAPFACLYRPK